MVVDTEEGVEMSMHVHLQPIPSSALMESIRKNLIQSICTLVLLPIKNTTSCVIDYNESS